MDHICSPCKPFSCGSVMWTILRYFTGSEVGNINRFCWFKYHHYHDDHATHSERKTDHAAQGNSNYNRFILISVLMDKRVRKRKSLWDVEDESQRISWSGKEHYSTYDGAHRRMFSAAKDDYSLLMPEDQAGWPSCEPLEKKDTSKHNGESIYTDREDKPEMEERGNNKNSYKSTSQDFDRWGRRKYSISPDDGLSLSHRHLEGGRNSSRDRGRSKSPSPSRSRGRDCGGMRSRNRNRNTAIGQTRSRSPYHERRREPQGWNDKSESGISSQTCRDFVAGNCRRGSQCRFLHPDSMDGDCLENDLAERWRSRPERGHTSSYCEGPRRQFSDKVSGSDYGEGDSFRNKSRGAICCKDFMRGKCKWGASCRFSHDVDSGNNNVKGTRSAFDRDREHQHTESKRPMCKYFLAGKCHRDNCWFSHDGYPANNHESRPGDEGECQGLANNNGWWNGPEWNQGQPESNIAKGTRWSENVANKDSADGIPIGRDNRWAHERRTRGSPEWKEKASENDDYVSTHDEKEDNGGDMVAVMSNSNDGQEYPIISQSLDSQNLDVICTVSHAPNITPEASSLHLSEATIHAGVFVKSDIQLHPTVLEDKAVNALSFDGLGESKDNRNTVNPTFITGQSLNQNVIKNLGINYPLVANDHKDDLFFLHPSNVQNFDLNGHGQVLSSSLTLQNQSQSHQKEAAKTPEMLEIVAPQSFYNNASNGQVAQFLLGPTAASSMQKFANEQAQAHPRTALNPLTSTGAVSSLEVNVHVQPNSIIRSPDRLDPLGNGRGKRGNSNQTSSEFCCSFEQKNHILFEEFSPMSGENSEFENALPSVSSKMQCPQSPELKQQETAAVLEAKDNNTNIAIESEKGQEDTNKENGDGNDKVGNSTGNKDDKDMRLFKNALVEFVKDILKPKWKEGRMSREVHKTIVKKVVDKVTSTMQGDHIPKTQDKIDQYLSHSKTKITKLVQAYVERHLKADS